MEGLVKAGAFDSIYKNRKILFNNISNIIQSSKNIYENKIQNQSSLFSDDHQKISYLIDDENKTGWNTEEVSSKEFESIGFYISDHPLNQFKDIFDDYKITDFNKFKSNSEIKVD